MADIRTDVILQGSTDLAKDRFINVFYHTNSGDSTTTNQAAQGAMRQLAAFYHESNLDTFLSPFINSAVKLVSYDMAAAIPRPELLTGVLTINAPTSESPLPEEVALCLSYYTDRNIKSHRGRIYLGPWNYSSTGATGGRSLPAAELMTTMAAAATAMVDHTASATGLVITGAVGSPDDAVSWELYSKVLNTFSPIFHGWVDNEWDGQRRRRVEATARTTW